jgi:threonine dehydrogenase-like Zn-dependent dehydrogenase
VPTPVIFECVGVPGMLAAIIDEAPARSRVVVVGVCMHPDTIEPFVAVVKEIELRFSFGYNGEEFAATLQRLGTGVPGARELVTQVVSLDDAASAFATLAQPGEHGKILIRPTEAP